MARTIRASALVIGLLAAIQPLPASAQARLSDIPDGFWTARRGRIVANPYGRWRVHYGRGANWAGITSFTNVAGYWGSQIVPYIPSILNPLAPSPGTAAPEGGAAPGGEFSPESGGVDAILQDHAEHMNTLNALLDESRQLVIKLGGQPRTSGKTEPATDGQHGEPTPVPHPGGPPQPGDDSTPKPAPKPPTS